MPTTGPYGRSPGAIDSTGRLIWTGSRLFNHRRNDLASDTLHSSSGVQPEAVQFNSNVSAMPEPDSRLTMTLVPMGTADTLLVR
jgi:hypothetical protein